MGFLFTTFLEEPSEHDDPFRLPGSAGRLDGDPDDILSSVYGFDHHDAAGDGMINDRLPARWRCLWRTATFVQWYVVLVARTHNDRWCYLIMMHLGIRLIREGRESVL